MALPAPLPPLHRLIDQGWHPPALSLHSSRNPRGDEATMHGGLQPIISISSLSKTYASGFQALKNVNLEIRRGEIFALLGPNGAGKTTLISVVCGIVNPSAGRVSVGGHDIISDF